MAFITLANAGHIIFRSDLTAFNLTRRIYKIPMYFWNKYEKNELIAIQELLEDPEKYFTDIYMPYEPIDTGTYVYEGQKPAYHKFSCCPKLQSDYQNFEVPKEIKEEGMEAIEKFRQWFEKVKHLVETKPDIFVARLERDYGIVTNPKAIMKGNSGFTNRENLTPEKLEERIDNLIKEAGRFYYKSPKNTTILRRFQKCAHGVNKNRKVYNNNTPFSDEDVIDLLIFYDNTFKQPIKRDLKEYYRLELNPEIKMEGSFLEQLGFKSCGNCHSTDYVPNKKT